MALGTGMSIKVHHSIIHGFEKESKKDVGNVQKTKVLLDSDAQHVKSLVHGVAALFGRRGNSQDWGRFGNDGRQGPFPARFDAFIANAADGANFLDMSHTILDEVTGLANKQQWATGGNVLCALYEFVEDIEPEAPPLPDDGPGDVVVASEPDWQGHVGELFLLVAMVKQKSGLSLDKNLVPIGISEVDMSKLHQAALIHVNEYHKVKALPPPEEGEDDLHDRIYLSFVAQRANRSSTYFVNALGCVIGLTPAQATKKLFTAVDAFFTERKEIQKYRREAKELLAKHLQDAAVENRVVTIDRLHEVLIRAVPEELGAHVADITEYLNDVKRKVPASFQPSTRALARFANVVLNGEGYQVRFERTLLGKDANSDFHYNKEQKTLTIRNLGKSLTDKLDGVLAGD